MVVTLKTSTDELVKFSEGEPFLAAAKETEFEYGSEYVHEILVDLTDYKIEKTDEPGYVTVKKKPSQRNILEGNA